MRYLYGVLVLGLVMAVAPAAAGAQVQVGMGWDRYGLDHLHMAVGDVYGYPVDYVPSYIYPEELPVVYLLAREARVSPEIVMALREQGWSWLDIAYHLRVDPYLFVGHLPYDDGYWGWRRGRDYRYLTDRHIIDYVNLAFWATYHRRPVVQLIIIRQRVPTWNYYVVHHRPTIVYHTGPSRYDRPTARSGQTERRNPPAPERRAQPRDPQQRNTATQPPARTQERTNLPTRTAERATRPPTETTRPAAQRTPPATQRTPPAAQRTPPRTQRTPPAAQRTPPPAQRTPPAAQRTPPRTQRTSPPAQRTPPAAQRSQPAARPSRPAARPSTPSAQRSRPTTSTRTRDSASSSRGSTSPRSSAAASRSNRRGG